MKESYSKRNTMRATTVQTTVLGQARQTRKDYGEGCELLPRRMTTQRWIDPPGKRLGFNVISKDNGSPKAMRAYVISSRILYFMQSINQLTHQLQSTFTTMTLPKTYRAAFQRKKNEPFSMEDVELKLPEEGQILVKVLAS